MTSRTGFATMPSLHPESHFTTSFTRLMPMPKVDKKIQTFLEKWLDTSVKKYVSHMDVRQNGGLHDLIIGGVEKPLLEIVLQETEGNRTKAANILGINRNTLRKKIQDYNIKCQNKS